MQLRNRGEARQKFVSNHPELPRKLCGEDYSLELMNGIQFGRERGNRARHPQETPEILTKGSQVSQSDVQALPADAPQDNAGGMLRKEVEIRAREGLLDLREVGYMPASRFIIGAIEGGR